MIWAPLKKSPNWASQIQRRFGVSQETPISNPRTANSDRDEFAISSFPCLDEACLVMRFRGIIVRSVFWSTSITCLWEKVPRPTSCPEIRTLYPSLSKEPNANASAVAQSSFVPSWTRLTRCSMWYFCNLGWTSYPISNHQNEKLCIQIRKDNQLIWRRLPSTFRLRCLQ